MNIFNRRRKENVQGSLFLAFFGVLVVLGSVALLWFNEGRINYGDVAEESIYINGATRSNNTEGQFVALEGDLFSEEQISDPLFIAPSPYIRLSREVEMFAWSESESSDEDTNSTSYSYSTGWTSSPEDSTRFEYQADHQNPAMPFNDAEFSVTTATVGAYTIDPRTVDLPTNILLDLNQINFNSETRADLSNPTQTGYELTADYLFIGYGSIEDPYIGDLRVQFYAVPHAKNATVFGEGSGDRIIPHVVKDDDYLYRVFFSGREAAIADMHGEYTFALWGTRFGGTVMMWIGMIMMVSPLTAVMNTLLTFIPFLQDASKFVVNLVLLPFALIISFVTITISFIAHNPLVLALLIGLIVLGVALAFYFNAKNKDEINPTIENDIEY